MQLLSPTVLKFNKTNKYVQFPTVPLNVRYYYENLFNRAIAPSLTGSETKVMTNILTRSLGWNKMGFVLFTSHLEKGSSHVAGVGLTRKTILKAIKGLEDKKIIITHMRNNLRVIWVNIGVNPESFINTKNGKDCFDLEKEKELYAKRMDELGLDFFAGTRSDVLDKLVSLNILTAEQVFMRARKNNKYELPEQTLTPYEMLEREAYADAEAATKAKEAKKSSVRVGRKVACPSVNKPRSPIAIIPLKVVESHETKWEDEEEEFQDADYQQQQHLQYLEEQRQDSIHNIQQNVMRRTRPHVTQQVEQVTPVTPVTTPAPVFEEITLDGLYGNKPAEVQQEYVMNLVEAERLFTEGTKATYGEEFKVTKFGGKEKGQMRHILNKLPESDDSDKGQFLFWACQNWLNMKETYFSWMKSGYMDTPSTGALLKYVDRFYSEYQHSPLRTLVVNGVITPVTNDLPIETIIEYKQDAGKRLELERKIEKAGRNMQFVNTAPATPHVPTSSKKQEEWDSVKPELPPATRQQVNDQSVYKQWTNQMDAYFSQRPTLIGAFMGTQEYNRLPMWLQNKLKTLHYSSVQINNTPKVKINSANWEFTPVPLDELLKNTPKM